MEFEKSLTESACEQLEKLIIFQQLKPGAMYSEKMLAEAVNLGRTPVREALQKLAWEQMVVIHPRRGIQIQDISVESQLKLLEVRRPLQGLCARLAAQRATAAQKGNMRQLADAVRNCEQDPNNELFLEYLRGCHEALVSGAKNDFIDKVMRPLQGSSRLFWFRYQDNNPDHPARLHAHIMNKVADGDAEGAEKASDDLIDYLVNFALAQLAA